MAKNKNGYTFNLANNTISFSRAFENRLNQGDSEALIALHMLQTDFPNMTITRKETAKRSTKNNLTYAKMTRYLNCLQNAEAHLKTFDAMCEVSKAQPSPYNFVRNWFKETYPDYNNPMPKFDAHGKIVCKIIDFPVAIAQ